jgi:glycosyltransferase involved in cell wall biosynthesis
MKDSADAISIAAVVLTKNENMNIERCLRSVSWCSERLLVDSGSTDGTRELAEAAGARVVINQLPGVFNIAEQRNWALRSAGLTSDWVLFLDADEEIPPHLRFAIENAIGASRGLYDAFELTPRYLFWGRWLKRTQGFPNWHSRLIRRGVMKFSGGVWEHFESTEKVGRIWEPYNHYANSKGLSDWLARHDRYSSWDAAKIAEFLDSHDAAAFGTQRKIKLRCWAARLYPLRPPARFFQMYVIRGGFLEGIPSFVLCGLYFFYECMTVIKVVELRRLKQCKPL